ncbi:MAG: exosortase C-terminal domain/associated protein EpsI, partial [Geminicoccaceae bacterium]
CVMIPVLANGLRAFGIIMLAHASNLQFAIGVDHLIYGWVFFALVMLLLIAIGQFMRDTADGAVMALPPQPPANTAPVWASLAVACLCLLPAALASAQSVRFAAMTTTEPGVFALAPAAPWRETAPTSWQPVIVGAHATWHNRYRAPGLPSVDLVVGYFTKQHQGAEVINSGHRLMGDPAWVRTAQRAREVPVHGRTVTVIEHEFTKDGAKRLLWSVAWVGGQFTGKPLLAKLHQGYAVLTGGEAAAALVLVGIIDSAAPMPEQRHALQAFIAASGDLGSALAQAGER